MKRIKDIVKRQINKQITTPDFYIGLENIISWTGNVNPLILSSENYPDTYQFIHKNSVCFSKLRPYLAKGFTASYNCIGTTELFCMKTKKKYYNRFINYYILNIEFINEINNKVNGIGLPRITWNDFSNMLIFNHFDLNLKKQIKIANFLDENCSKIDTEVSLLEKKSKLLEEYKQSFIFETVTKGVDKNAEMKDSGINWIGEIPKDKLLIRIKNILKQGIKSNIPASEKEEDGIYDFYLSGSNVKKSNNYITDKEILLLPDGGNFYVHYNKEKNKCAYSNHVIPYVNKKNFNLKYMYYFLISNKEILNNMLFNGIGIKNLDRKSFLDVFIVNFNRKEQENIVVFLDNETNKINKKIELINEKVELLKEYKQSLIYEAVTGQLEIE